MPQLFCCQNCNQEITLRKINSNLQPLIEYKCGCLKDYLSISPSDLISNFSASIELDNPESFQFNLCTKHHIDYIAYCNSCDIPICPLCETEHSNHIIDLIVDYVNNEFNDKILKEFKDNINKQYEESEEINNKFYEENSKDEYTKGILKKKFDRISNINSTLYFIIKHYFDFDEKYKPKISLNNTQTIKYLYYNHKEIKNYFLSLKPEEIEKEDLKKIKSFTKIEELAKIEFPKIEKAIFLSNEQYLIAFEENIQIFSDKFKMILAFKNSSKILDINELSDFNIIFSSEEGKIKLAKMNKNNKFIIVNQFDNIKANYIFQLFDENIITFDCESGNLILRNLNHIKNEIFNYKYEDSEKEKTSFNILEIFQKNLLLVSFDKEVLIFKMKESNMDLLKKIDKGENFGQSNINILNENKVMIGCNNGSIMFLNLDNFEFEIKKFIENTEESNIIFVFSYNSNNIVYITLNGHLFQRNLEKNKITSSKKYFEKTLISNFIYQNGKILCIYNNKILKLLKI